MSDFLASNNFYTVTTVNSTSFDGYISWNFVSVGLLMSLDGEGANGDVIDYSFDGINLHGQMKFGEPSAALSFDNRALTKVYFRKSLGPSPSIDVRVEAWKS